MKIFIISIHLYSKVHIYLSTKIYYLVNKKEELNKAIEFAFSYDDSIIIEEEIKGFEVGCAILGNNNLIIGEVDEIDLPNDFFDYNMKPLHYLTY